MCTSKFEVHQNFARILSIFCIFFLTCNELYCSSTKNATFFIKGALRLINQVFRFICKSKINCGCNGRIVRKCCSKKPIKKYIFEVLLWHLLVFKTRFFFSNHTLCQNTKSKCAKVKCWCNCPNCKSKTKKNQNYSFEKNTKLKNRKIKTDSSKQTDLSIDNRQISL